MTAHVARFSLLELLGRRVNSAESTPPGLLSSPPMAPNAAHSIVEGAAIVAFCRSMANENFA
jgi:hypothetical protein